LFLSLFSCWYRKCGISPSSVCLSMLAADPSSTVISGQVMFFGVSIFINSLDSRIFCFFWLKISLLFTANFYWLLQRKKHKVATKSHAMALIASLPLREISLSIPLIQISQTFLMICASFSDWIESSRFEFNFFLACKVNPTLFSCFSTTNMVVELISRIVDLSIR